MICRFCGTQLDDRALTCHKCGARVDMNPNVAMPIMNDYKMNELNMRMSHIEQNSDQQLEYIRKVKGWVTFFGIVTIIGIVCAFGGTIISCVACGASVCSLSNAMY